MGIALQPIQHPIQHPVQHLVRHPIRHLIGPLKVRNLTVSSVFPSAYICPAFLIFLFLAFKIHIVGPHLCQHELAHQSPFPGVLKWLAADVSILHIVHISVAEVPTAWANL